MTELLDWFIGWLLLSMCLGYVGGVMHRAVQQVAEKAASF